jgi:hypothetical protein
MALKRTLPDFRVGPTAEMRGEEKLLAILLLIRQHAKEANAGD